MKTPPSPQAKQKYDEITEQLSHLAPIVSSQMFGMPTVKLDGKAVFGLFGDDMVFKLPIEQVAPALAMPGATLFDPMGGRPMKQWVQVPFDQADSWLDLAQKTLPA
jgi:hypothetical protein